MVIEIYIDSAQLAQNESLVIVDENGKRTEVAEALATSADSSPRPTKHGGKFCEVVLERWTVELGNPEGYTTTELNDPLPNVYKKGVTLFRSLYTFLRYMPAWRLHKRLGRHAGSHHALKLKFRIRQGRGLADHQKDTLYTPLCPSEQDADSIVDHYEFHPLVSPVGPLHVMVVFRRNCGFAVADQESLLSSRFLGLDDLGPPYMHGGRSLPGERTAQPRDRYSATAAPTRADLDRPPNLLGAYGSLGTFHGSNNRNSPVSELRHLQDEYEDGGDMNRLNAIRAEEGASKRRSYIEQPAFKAGSLASSPRPSPSPGTSAGRAESALSRYAGGAAAASSSKRSSLNTLPQQQLRTPPLPNETAVASSGSSSPKPAPVRYSSSFAGRTRRFTSQSSKAAESNTSSGRGSSDSREKPDQPLEGTAGDSSGTKTDEDDIASFISDLEKSKDIKFHTPPSNRDNVVNLSKYSQLRDPNAQLADEMSSSSLIQASTTPPSRRLSNVPGLSMSSSPSRALAHAPHVRSRLSTSIVEETGVSRTSGASGEAESPKIPEAEEDEDDGEELPFIFPHDNNEDNID
jgi:autophagy-related protein 13